MSRNLIFSLVFGVIFYLVLLPFLVPDTISTYLDTVWILPMLIVGFFALRMVTIWMGKAQKAGADMVDRVLPPQPDEDGETPPPSLPQPTEETYMQMLTGLFFIGPWITLGLALVAMVIATMLLVMVPGASEWVPDKQLALTLILGGFLSIPWLLLLEWWGKVRINVPIIPIPLVWLAPLVIIWGAYMLFTLPAQPEPTAPPSEPARTTKSIDDLVKD